MPSRLPSPSRPAAPPAPAGFPPVRLFWVQTMSPVTSPETPAAAAVVSRKLTPGVESTPAPRPEPTPVPEVAPKLEAKPEPKPELKPVPKPDAPSMSPTKETLADRGVKVPVLVSAATAAEKDFHEKATRALERVYLEDSDDPAILMSLYEKMTSEQDLKGACDVWRTPLELAMDRSETLQRGSAAIRALRRAFANARPTETLKIYSGLDLPQCRAGFASLHEIADDALAYDIKIEHVGRLKLRDFEEICTYSQTAELKGRSFPELTGAAQLKKMVRLAYGKAFKGRIVLKVAIPGTWEDSDDGNRRTLRAVIGYKRNKAFPEHPCVMEEVLLDQEKKGKKFGKPVCCEVESSLAISCNELD
jgi:hypothetical protein